MQQFDPNIPDLITGDIKTVIVVDPAKTFDPYEVGNHVVVRDEPFDVRVEWALDGDIAKLWLAALSTSQWDVSVYAESMGGGSEVRLGTANVTVNPLQLSYNATINVPPNTLDEHASGTDRSGVYKLVVAVFLNSNLGAPGYDITGFSEGPFIQVEAPE